MHGFVLLTIYILELQHFTLNTQPVRQGPCHLGAVPFRGHAIQGPCHLGAVPFRGHAIQAQRYKVQKYNKNISARNFFCVTLIRTSFSKYPYSMYVFIYLFIYLCIYGSIYPSNYLYISEYIMIACVCVCVCVCVHIHVSDIFILIENICIKISHIISIIIKLYMYVYAWVYVANHIYLSSRI